MDPQEDIRSPLNTFTSHSQYFLPISRAIHRSQHSLTLNGFLIHDLDLRYFLIPTSRKINNSNNIFNNNIIYQPFENALLNCFYFDDGRLDRRGRGWSYSRSSSPSSPPEEGCRLEVRLCSWTGYIDRCPSCSRNSYRRRREGCG